MNTLNENIVRLRKQAGMTQEELGRRVMVSTQAVSRWERGGSPDIALLPAIAQVFGVTLDELFGRESEKTVPVEEMLTEELLHTLYRIPLTVAQVPVTGGTVRSCVYDPAKP